MGPDVGRAAPDHANQADFGANEWLVEELYQRYLADPGSVDRAWWSFFADYQPTLPNGTGPQPVIGLQGAPQAPAPQTVRPPSPTPSGPQSSPGAETPRAQQAPAQVPAPPAAVPSPPSPAAPPPPSSARPSPPPPALPSPPTPALLSPPTPALLSPPSPPEGTEVSRLRGAAARTVTNMTASLAVPTATSVRAVPAKLLADNRIVINNHLRRGRGGKVSFTHLIGYAVVTALGRCRR